AAAHPHPQLEPLEPIEPPDSLAIHPPAFAAQQHPDPQVPEAGPRMRQISNAQPQRGLILRLTAPIPTGAAELCQAAGPRTPHLEGRLKPLSELPATGGPQTFF